MINMDIVVMILNLTHVLNSHYWLVNVAKKFFGVDNSSLRQAGNKEKNILVHVDGPTYKLDDNTKTATAKCSFNNIGKSKKEICLSVHWYATDSSFIS